MLFADTVAERPLEMRGFETAVTPTRVVPPLVLRRATPEDVPLLAAMLEGLSPRTRYLRYFTARPLAGPEALREARRMTGERTTTLIATSHREREALAAAELATDPRHPLRPEAAIVVRDDEQGRGLGTLLMRYLLRVARQQGASSIGAVVLAENRAALAMVRRLGAPYTLTADAGEVHVEIAV
jgi:acetyltransferase